MSSGTEVGQSFEAKPSGVHWSNGQTKGQIMNPGRRGLGKPKSGVWDPLGWPQTTTKVVVVRWDTDEQGRWLPCRCVPRVKRSTQKIHKNMKSMEITSSTDRLITQAISNPRTHYKNHENSGHFGEKLIMHFLTF